MAKTRTGFSFRRLFSFMIKETYEIQRDWSALALAFLMPLLLIFIYGYALNLDADHNKIGLVVEGPSNQSSSLIQSFKDSPQFQVTISHDRRELENLLLARKINAIVVIPEDFEQQLLESKVSTPIQVITDGSETNTAGLLTNFIRGAWGNWLAQRQLVREAQLINPITVTDRVWFNPAAISHYSIIPGSVAVIMTIVGTLLTALVFAREWEQGTLESLMPTPITIMELIFGKLIPYYFLALGSLVVCVTFSVFVLGVPFRGSIFVLFAVSSVFLLAALNMGLFISTSAKTVQYAFFMSVYLAYLPSQFLSGFIFEVKSMPAFLQFIAGLLPAKYFVTSLQTLFLAGDIYVLIIEDCLAMLAIAAVFTYLNYRQLRKRLD